MNRSIFQSLLKIFKALSCRTMDFSRIIRSDGVSPPAFSFPDLILDFFSSAMISPPVSATHHGMPEGNHFSEWAEDTAAAHPTGRIPVGGTSRAGNKIYCCRNTIGIQCRCVLP